jgi:hypothetical protein
MRSTIHNDGLALLQHGEQAQPTLITQAQVPGLPQPVQRYLSYTLVVGKEPIRTVRLKQQGVMRTQPGQKWLPMIAEQYFTTAPPAFLWHGTMRLFPLVSMSGTDRFIDGHGSMRIKLLSLITVGNARGPEMDQGELLRYLAETTWFPTAWLSDAIEWQAIDAHCVKATIHQQDVMASAVLQVNEQGQVTSLSAERYVGEHGQLTPWSGQYEEYQEVDGMRIPTRVEVTWHLASGEFTWFRCKITEIEYNQSGRVTVL